MQRHKLYACFLLLQIFLGRYCYGQTAIEDTLFRKFRNDIQSEQEAHNGYVVWDDETQETYCLLMLTHGAELLVKYTDDSIPAVRARLFGSLVQKKADRKVLRAILDKHVHDTATFISSPTDMVMTWTVKGYMKFLLDYSAKHMVPDIDYKAQLETVRKRFQVIVAGAHHDMIAKDSLLSVDRLICSEKGIRIISFSMIIRERTIKVNNVLTEEIKSMIRALNPGERVFFEEITAELPDGSLRKLASIVLMVK